MSAILRESSAAKFSPSRLEAFSDGVIAIIVTIMVLELRPPEEPTFHSLRAELPVFLAYGLSFLFVAVYWVNHHHLLKATKTVDGRVLWTNTLLLFVLSIVPFATAWVGEAHEHRAPAVLYGVLALLCGGAYTLLVKAICAANADSAVVQAIGNDVKGKCSVAIYAVGVGLAFVHPWLAYAMYAIVNLIWFVPDRRLEGLGE